MTTDDQRIRTELERDAIQAERGYQRSLTQTTFRTGDLAPALASRTRANDAAGATAKRDLGRYYALLASELREAVALLSEAEISLIVDSLNGTQHEPFAPRLLVAGVADAIRLDGLAVKWGVGGGQLLDTLGAMSAGQLAAIIDAAERFWLGVDGDADTTGGLRRVGLLR